MISSLFLLFGLGLLYIGAQVLIKGGVGLAFRFGLSALVVGLTVIAYGTSSPEMVVSIKASLDGTGALAVGNVIGSNICNIGLILGLCALVSPLTATAQVIRREIPILIGVSVLLVIVLWDGSLGRIDGVVLLAGLLIYTWLTLRQARTETSTEAGQEYDQDFHRGQPSLGRSITLVLIGFAGLIAGSHLFVTGAVDLAKTWGASDAVIGLTVVAFGTSLPELATSLVAAIRRHGDVAIGSIVGSNIFNVLGILSVAALLQPIDTSEISRLDLGVMLVTAVALLPLAHSGGRINRIEGAALLSVYIGYTAWLMSQVGS